MESIIAVIDKNAKMMRLEYDTKYVYELICRIMLDHDHDIHSICKLVSLEQRRRIQLLILLYNNIKDVTMHKIFRRETRRSRRIVFKTDSKEETLYKRSLYFVESKLWDTLPLDIIEMPDVFSFKARLIRMNINYVDLLSTFGLLLT